ncbi:hypothetical protein [Longitalea arenae]|uniref:hypothetical protein n=1 Tax=Longitalea arenae TaxID=2812558 RepID=UPI001967C2A0|nr:hypothetical protein [Longitalea arenae]
MKKTIKILLEKMDKLQEKDGTLQGGFASIKGGFNVTYDSENKSNCTNSGDCTRTTNTGTPTCVNSGTCFF